MKVKVVENNDIVIFKLEGEMSIFFKDELSKVIDEKISQNIVKFIFDMEKIEYIDSAGLSMIVIAGNKALDEGHRVKIVSPNAQVKHVLEVARIDSIVEFEDSTDNAIASFNT